MFPAESVSDTTFGREVVPEVNEVEQHFRYEIGMVEADRIENSGHSQSFPASSNLTTRKLPMNRGSVCLQGRVQPLRYMDMWFLQTGAVIARHIHGFYALIKTVSSSPGCRPVSRARDTTA